MVMFNKMAAGVGFGTSSVKIDKNKTTAVFF